MIRSMRRCAGTTLFAALALLSGNIAGASYVSVGSASQPLSEWGVTVLDAPSIDQHPSFAGFVTGNNLTNTVGAFTYFYSLEDQRDLPQSDGDLLGPNQGGQNYDTEFLGVGMDGDRLVIAIVTGQRPDNLLANFSPGDIRIVTSAGVFGVEVGGSAAAPLGYLTGSNNGNSSDDSAGSTYKLYDSGHTKGVKNSDGTTDGSGTSGLSLPADQTAGSVWLTADNNWMLDPISSGSGDFTGKQPVQLQQLVGGARIGQADYFYSLNSVTLQHAIIEVSIPTSYLQNSTLLSVQWAPSCGNDVLRVTQTMHMPEPASWALLLIGGLGVAARRRQSSRAA